MLRQIANKIYAQPGLWRAASTAPSVYDKLVQVTVIDRVGRRHHLRGYEGQTVVDVLKDNDFENDICLSPEGRDTWQAHIKVPQELSNIFPAPQGDDQSELEDIADNGDIDGRSRLGSKITLSKELDGIIVALGGLRPWKSL